MTTCLTDRASIKAGRHLYKRSVSLNLRWAVYKKICSQNFNKKQVFYTIFEVENYFCNICLQKKKTKLFISNRFLTLIYYGTHVTEKHVFFYKKTEKYQFNMRTTVWKLLSNISVFWWIILQTEIAYRQFYNY